MTRSRPAVGFVGLGDQGLPIAQAIADGPFTLHVWARHATSLDGLTGHEHVVEPDIASLGGACDIVALCLPEDSDVLAIATTGGLLAAMREGGILVDHGTGLPSVSRQLAELAIPHGVTVVDAPVSGGHAVAVARQLTTIVGGSDADVARVTPIFEAFSKEIIHVGPVGSGQFGKLLNNALMMINHQSLAEVLAIAERLRLETPRIVDVLRSGSASSVALMAFGPSITRENAAHLRKLEEIDVGLFAEAVRPAGEDARAVVERATAGAEILTDLTAMILR